MIGEDVELAFVAYFVVVSWYWPGTILEYRR